MRVCHVVKNRHENVKKDSSISQITFFEPYKLPKEDNPLEDVKVVTLVII